MCMYNMNVSICVKDVSFGPTTQSDQNVCIILNLTNTYLYMCAVLPLH
jgi:hypothetical protein